MRFPCCCVSVYESPPPFNFCMLETVFTRPYIKHPVALFHVQCHYYRHNATQSHIYILLFLPQHVSASVGHLQVLDLTQKLLYCIE
jgi:hypothetical protein